MTDHEWDSFVQLYRELWKAYADLATMRTMLTTSEFAAEQNRPDIAMKAVRGWMARLGKSRGANFYAKYLAKGEAHIAQAGAERSDKLLIQLLSQDRPPEFPPSTPTQ
jgi:Trp operon repressor